MKTSCFAWAALLLGLIVSACSTPSPAPTSGPAAVVQARYDALNAGKVDAAAALFADDAVFVSSPNSLARGATLKGRGEIRANMQREADSGARVEAYNYQVNGDTVTYWVRAFVGGRMVNNASLKAVVRDGKIVSQSPL
ncbi:MAG: nuclear transport factor 2 family protein [Rubrivivax sp.]|nr:nuclear transport factor 2 family protein [Rubrivivax sp.]